MNKNKFWWYFCSDDLLMKNMNYPETIKKIIRKGFNIIQLRFKNTKLEDIVKITKSVQKVTKRYNVPLILNDYWEIAKKLNCDGIHIGQDDTPINIIKREWSNQKIIGVSCTNLEEALIAEKNGASYLGVGSIFSTNTKLDAKIIGLNELKKIKENVNIPVIAIGGISIENIELVLKTKIDGIAMISEILKNVNKKVCF